jgi:hypothetical protein
MASIAVTTPVDGTRVQGKVDVRVQVTGGNEVGDVVVVIGDPTAGTKKAERTRRGDFRYRWDTTRQLAERTDAPSDAVFWITARAVVDGVEVQAPYVVVTTANNPVAGAQGAGGWRPELAWAAHYVGTKREWLESHEAVVGGDYAELRDDPVLGRERRVMEVSVPNSAKDDEDQPTSSTVRFQSSSAQNIREGDEFCVGFAFFPPEDFPTVYPEDDVTNPRGPEATGYIAIFQFYGPPYEQGAPFLLQARRRTPEDPVDEFLLRGNELNPGDPATHLSLPYRRGRWTDVVFRIRASSSIEDGWVETYVNQGESTAVRPLLINGRLRVPRVLLRPNSEPHRTDMQIYRVNDRYERVTLWHTGHKITRTVEEADPRSYREGES